MDAELSRSKIVKVNDPHNWNSFDHYCTIHETRLEHHPLIDWTQPNTLSFDSVEVEGVLHLNQSGKVYCKHNVILEVEKWFWTRDHLSGLQIKGYLYKYIAWIKNGHIILRYHNLHENLEDYVHRVFDYKTGAEIFYEVLTRNQFPVLSEVLDEIELLVGS